MEERESLSFLENLLLAPLFISVEESFSEEMAIAANSPKAMLPTAQVKNGLGPKFDHHEM